MFQKTCKNKFWLENPGELLCNLEILPLSGESIEKQMNAISRLIILVFLLLVVLDIPINYEYYIISFIFIIILYYIQKKNMNRNITENYNGNYNHSNKEKYCRKSSSLRQRQPQKRTNQYKCKDSLHHGLQYNQINMNNSFKSSNQSLAGSANPKTFIQPVIAPPPAAFDYWKDNNLSNHSHINSESHYDDYLSGYEISGQCKRSNVLPKQVIDFPYTVDGIKGEMIDGPVDEPNIVEPNVTQEGGFSNNVIKGDLIDSGVTDPYEQKLRDSTPGDINYICGYNPKQLQSNLPTNLAAGNCMQDPAMNEYNKNLFTQNIQPGVYTRSQINEPINHNIGRSFAQQFRPLTYIEDEHGLTITEHDPRLIDEPAPKEISYGPTEFNVYDPRHNGYGTSYRGYNEKVTGQPRWMYDDIDAVRKPNYVSRSKIDWMPFADSYGPLNESNKRGNPNHCNIRQMVHDNYLEQDLIHRTELQQRLLRKRNNEMWQTRVKPINKAAR